MFQMRPLSLLTDLYLPCKVPSSSQDGFDGYCDGCLEVRDGLGVVLIHPVFEVTPQKSGMGSGLVSAVTTPGCTCGWAGWL